MKKFMILHFGFEQPSPEVMERWGKWFESIADQQVDQGGVEILARCQHRGQRNRADVLFRPICLEVENAFRQENPGEKRVSTNVSLGACEAHAFSSSLVSTVNTIISAIIGLCAITFVLQWNV